MRHLFLLAVVLLLAPLLPLPGTVEAGEPEGTGNALVGQRFGATGALEWMSPDGGAFRFSASPYTLVRWWTNGCPHCSASLPALAQLERKYAARGLRLLAVYHPKGGDLRSRQRIRGYLRRLGFEGEAAYDPRWVKLKELMKRGHLTRATSVSFLVDRHGIVRWVHAGPRLYRTRDPAWAHADRSLRELDAFLGRVLPHQAGAGRLLFTRSQEAWCSEPDGTQARAIALGAKPDNTPVWGPAGRRLAFSTLVEGKRQIGIAAGPGKGMLGGKKVLAEKAVLYDAGVGDLRVEAVRWSPNGDALLFILGSLQTQKCGVFRLDLADGSVKPTAQDGRPDIAACWGPAGRFLAIVTATKRGQDEHGDFTNIWFDAAIDVLDLQSGARKRVVQPERYIFDVSWSPDGRTLAYGSASGLRLVEPDGSNRRAVSSKNISPQPLWSADGTRLLVSYRVGRPPFPSGGISWDLAMFTSGGRFLRRWRALGTILGAAWSPDGRAIALVRESHLLRVEASGGEPTMLSADVDIAGVSWR